MDVAECEAVEKQLSAMIERRSRGIDPTESEPLYAESVRRYHEERRQAIRAEWHHFFCLMARSLHRRAEDYERRAEALCRKGPV